MGFDPLDCLTDCIGTIICDYLCCCCCAPSSPGDEVKDGVVDGLVDATTFWGHDLPERLMQILN